MKQSHPFGKVAASRERKRAKTDHRDAVDAHIPGLVAW
jgi:hypothetical protein